MKLKKGIPLIDQHDKHGFWGGKFGGNFVPETLKKPIEDLESQFNKLKNDKKNKKEEGTTDDVTNQQKKKSYYLVSSSTFFSQYLYLFQVYI